MKRGKMSYGAILNDIAHFTFKHLECAKQIVKEQSLQYDITMERERFIYYCVNLLPDFGARIIVNTLLENLDRKEPEFETLTKALDAKFDNRLPDGEMIGWKKALFDNTVPCIVKLRIPEDAKRSKGIGNKCRCNKAIIESIYILNIFTNQIMSANSWYDHAFKYTLGNTVEVDDFDDCPWIECSTGIHFFQTEEEAINYEFR